MAESHGEASPSWPRPAFLAAILAALLCTSGLMLAIRQARALYELRVSNVRSQSRELAIQLGNEVTNRIERALMYLAIDMESGRPPQIRANSDWPEWLGPPDLWNDGVWNPIRVRIPGVTNEETSRLDRASLDNWVRLALTGPAVSGPSSSAEPAAALISGRPDGQPVMFAQRRVTVQGRVQHLLARLDTERLQSVFELRLETVANQIHLVSSITDDAEDGEPLGVKWHLWSFRPTPSYLNQLGREWKTQVTVNVLAMLAAVLALLAVVGGLVRIARREMALSKLKDDFVADVSHELKTPLTLIRMFGETLSQGRVTSPERAKEYYEIIIRESTRLAHLIENILDFSEMRVGKKVYPREPLDLSQVVRQTYESYRHQLDHQGFTHSLRIEEGLPQIHGNADAIAQAVLNLISNAEKYSDTDRSLEITLTRETRRGRHGVLITVQDEGIGIKPEDLPHLFDGFFRGGDDRVRKRRGAGLGLSVVKQVVDAHQGIVEAEPRLVKGSTFRIFLPEQPASDGRPATESGGG